MAAPSKLLKSLIAVTVLTVSGTFAWQKLSPRFLDTPTVAVKVTAVQVAQAPQTTTGTSSPTVAVKAPAPAAPAAVAAGTKNQSPIGSVDNPLRVSLVSFHGYAPALVANGNSMETKKGSIYDRENVAVKFLLQDDIPTLSTLFESGAAQCAWRTSDSWVQEQPNLRNAGGDGRAVMAVDNTQGADAIITANPNINRVEDLPGHTLALLQYTPSHGMSIDAIENSALSAKKKSSVKFVYVNADEGTMGVRAILESGSADAVALWDPDLSLALKNVPGAKVIYSTKTASNLIYDVIVCDKKVIDTPAGFAAIQKLVNGWMAGVKLSKAQPDLAVDALIATEELFNLLAKKEGKGFIKGLFPTLVWTDVEQNARIFGLNGQAGHYARVYTRFDQIYRAAGALANPKSPTIAPQDSFDPRFIQKLLDKDQIAAQNSTKPEFTFSEATKEKVTAATQVPVVTKPILVNFATGSAELSKRAEQVIDKELVPFIENNGSSYFELSGNTDSTGSLDGNMRLSLARAKSVVGYLVRQWELPVSRFKVVGNGPTKPICSETKYAEEGMTLEQCQAMNRSTRVGVYGK